MKPCIFIGLKNPGSGEPSIELPAENIFGDSNMVKIKTQMSNQYIYIQCEGKEIVVPTENVAYVVKIS